MQPGAVTKGVHKIFAHLGTEIVVKCKSLNMLCDVLYYDPDPARALVHR